MRDKPLPADMVTRWGHLRFLQYKGNGEWHSECPVCGDSGHGPGNGQPDRFHLHEADGSGNARGACRRCGHFEWVDQDNAQPPDPERIKQTEELRRRYAEQEQLRLRSMIEKFRQGAAWKAYHDAMREAHRALWRRAGIPDNFQDYWELGFTEYETRDFRSPALTIPYFQPGREAVNIQYRLTNPPQPNDKYRFSYGLKPDLWLSEPEAAPSGSCLLVEGMKKAAVCFIELVAKSSHGLAVVAVPGKTPGQEMMEKLAGCEPIYVALDPDTYFPTRTANGSVEPAAVRLGRMLGDRARYVKLPAKADDLFVDYGMNASRFMRYVRHATREC